MKKIQRDKKFTKNYVSRVSRSPKVQKQFENRVRLFLNGERRNPINDHALIGKKLGLRAFSITGDIRVVYKETDDPYIFLDIGSHNQVY